jgi:flagellar biosynthesis chaperone FliJ
VILFLTCCGCAAVASSELAARDKTQERRLEAGLQKSPIDRVLDLLTEMKGQLEQEATADEETYGKMQCWCTSSEESTKKKVEEAEAQITQLESEVEASSAKKAELATKVEHLKSELAEKKAALKTARAIREKEQAEFAAEETDMVEAITMLKNALTILGRHNTGLLQVTPAIRESMNSALQWVALKHEELMALNPQRRNSLRGRGSSFLFLGTGAAGQSASGSSLESVLLAALTRTTGKAAHPAVGLPVKYGARVLAAAAAEASTSKFHGQAASFAQQQGPAHLESYTPQSGQIFGVLNQMLEEFQSNLNSAQKSELQAKEAYAELKEASEKQISAGAELLDELEAEHAATLKALSDAKESLSSTRESRSADVKFLSDLNLECKDLDDQWEKRSHARMEEIKAVGDAIAILTEDDARTLFRKKMSDDAAGSPAAFVQVRSHVASSFNSVTTSKKLHASAVLLKMAQKLLSNEHGASSSTGERLAALALRVKTDALSEVTAAINAMITDLESQQKAEVAQKDNCTTELRETEKNTYASEQRLADVEEQISTLQAMAKQLTADIAAARDSIADTKHEVKVAGETRASENKEFQEEVSDQRMIQNLLKKAISRLSAVYSTSGESGFLQQEPISPHKFQAYKQNAGASGVISLLESIVSDSAALEKSVMEAEQSSQQAYEEFTLDATASIKKLNATIETKERQQADVALEEEEAQTEKSSEESVLEDLKSYDTDLHVQCDFLLKNFDIRQKARLQEVESLKEAKAFLAGMMK